MSKQSVPIRKQCQHSSQCARDGIWGVYTWTLGQTDVNLDKPIRVFCGQHKRFLDRSLVLRNVRVDRRVPAGAI